MFTVEVTLKTVPATVSVQRKELSDAEALYQQLLGALRDENLGVIELTCERQEDKKVAFLGSQVLSVQLSGKAKSSSSGGRPPGFLALATEDEGEDS
ncbi:MAG: hypothetical protein AAGF75_03085 [Cyanobacteria bacterium P01_H01_bin.130]